MSAKGYCTLGDVEAFLGLALNEAQLAQGLTLLETVEWLIDAETGRTWLTGALTDETYRPADWPDGLLYLRSAPVTSLTALSGRPAFGEADVALVADTDFEVMDLSGGVIRLVEPSGWDRLQADYTPVATLPAPVRAAAAEWVAALLQPTLRPDTYGLESFSVPDLTVKYARPSADNSGIPWGVKLKLDALDAYPDLPGVA